MSKKEDQNVKEIVEETEKALLKYVKVVAIFKTLFYLPIVFYKYIKRNIYRVYKECYKNTLRRM